MRGKLRIIAICLTLHIAASIVFFGGMRVYQQGYNTMHREQIAMASIRITGERAEIQLLEEAYTFPALWLRENSPAYAAAYVLAGESLRFWVYLKEIFL